VESHKRPEISKHDNYPIFCEIGLVVVLLLFILVFRYNFGENVPDVYNPEVYKNELLVLDDHFIELKEIPKTNPVEAPPPPPHPRLPAPIPEDDIIEDEIEELLYRISTELGLSNPIDLPPPPKKEPELEDEDVIFVIVQRMPELIGGLKSVRNEITYPERAIRNGIEGRVFVQFIINEDGNVESPEVIRGIGHGCDVEVVNAVKKIRFLPGMQRGRPVRVKFTISVLFRLYRS